MLINSVFIYFFIFLLIFFQYLESLYNHRFFFNFSIFMFFIYCYFFIPHIILLYPFKYYFYFYNLTEVIDFSIISYYLACILFLIMINLYCYLEKAWILLTSFHILLLFYGLINLLLMVYLKDFFVNTLIL